MTRIQVANLGVLRQADIDLDRRVLLFCGPDSTGKSYAATTIFGFYRVLSEGTAALPDLSEMEPLVEDLIHEREIVRSLEECYLEALQPMLSSFGQELQANLVTLFGTPQQRFADTEIYLRCLNPPMARAHLHALPLSLQRMVDGVSLRVSLDWHDNQIRWVRSGREPNPRILRRLVSNIMSEFISWCLSGMVRPAVFPVERMAIAVFGRDLPLRPESLVRRAQQSETLTQTYSLATYEHDRLLERLAHYLDDRGELADLAEELERRVLRGTVRISDVKELSFVPDHGRPVTMMMAGPVVKSLAVMVAYLRHMASDTDVMIVEDPEMNLQPEMRRSLARILAKVANRGIKLLISTHSKEIADEFSDLVLVGSGHPKAKKLIRRFGYREEENLKPEDIGVYLFQGDRADPVPVGPGGFTV